MNAIGGMDTNNNNSVNSYDYIEDVDEINE